MSGAGTYKPRRLRALQEPCFSKSEPDFWTIWEPHFRITVKMQYTDTKQMADIERSEEKVDFG